MSTTVIGILYFLTNMGRKNGSAKRDKKNKKLRDSLAEEGGEDRWYNYCLEEDDEVRRRNSLLEKQCKKLDVSSIVNLC